MNEGILFNYRLKQIDRDGKFEYSEIINVKAVPSDYKLFQNYPNPFNPSTTIKYQIPKEGFVILKIYNILGSEVNTIVNGKQDKGFYSVEFNGSILSSGVYIYRLEVKPSDGSKGFSQMKKLMLLK